jgi:peptidoglycan/LPS O-acetylase OafA/YrhL
VLHGVRVRVPSPAPRDVNTGTPFASVAAVYLSFFFLAGMACYRFGWREAPRRWHLLALRAFVALFGGTVIATLAGARPTPDGAVGNLLGILFCLLAMLLRFRSRPLEWLGAKSFAIFLFHYAFVQLCRMAFITLDFHDATVSIVVTTTVALLGSVALERLLKSWRITRTLALGERWQRAERLGPHSHRTSSTRTLNSPRSHDEKIGDP